MSTIKVTNRSGSIVVYKIPELNIRREFYSKESKQIEREELEKAVVLPGVRELFYNYLFIDDEDFLHEKMNVAEEPEYWLTEDQIPTWINSCTLAEFEDAVNFAPTGVKDLIKDYSVSVPLNDSAKREILNEKLGFNVSRAIEITKEAAEPVEETEGRKSNPNYKTKTESTPGRKTTGSKYKVISTGK